jgi:hypothetical protein
LTKSGRIEWFFRIATFGSAVVAGIIGAWGIWVSFKDISTFLIYTLTFAMFTLAFATIIAFVICIVKKRKLRMLQT